MYHRHPYRFGCSRVVATWPAMFATGGPPRPVADAHVGHERIDDAATALELIGSVTSDPVVHETLVVLLDAEHRGHKIVNVDRTVEHDSVLGVADLVTEMAYGAEDIGAVIIASIRPDGSDELDDVDRWLTIDEQLAMVGIELVEWFVIGRSVSCPRSLLGDVSRWAA